MVNFVGRKPVGESSLVPAGTFNRYLTLSNGQNQGKEVSVGSYPNATCLGKRVDAKGERLTIAWMMRRPARDSNKLIPDKRGAHSFNSAEA